MKEVDRGGGGLLKSCLGRWFEELEEDEEAEGGGWSFEVEDEDELKIEEVGRESTNDQTRVTSS